jgi:hypothetical protein
MWRRNVRLCNAGVVQSWVCDAHGQQIGSARVRRLSWVERWADFPAALVISSRKTGDDNQPSFHSTSTIS